MSLTSQEVTNYVASLGLQMTPAGIRQALITYNGQQGNPANQLSINDIGAAFGMSPAQSAAWMAAPTPVAPPTATPTQAPPAAQPAQASVKTFTEAFGPNARLQRLTNNQSAPFIIADAPTERKLVDGSWQDVATSPPSYWTYNQSTGAFDNHGDIGGKTPGNGRSVSAAELGITSDPAFNIAGVASKTGQNGDTWSDYAYKTQGPNNLSVGLRNDIGKISGYDNDPGAFNQFVDKYGPAIVATVATAGTGLFGAKAGVGGTTSSKLLEATTGGTFNGLSKASMQSALISAGIAPSTAASISPSLVTAAASGGATGLTSMLTSIGVPSSVANIVGSKLGLTAIGAVTGGLLGGSSGGAQQAGTTTTTQAPWAPMQPYMLDVANKAASNYSNASTMTPQQQSILSQAQKISAGQLNNTGIANMQNSASGILGGTSNLFQPAANTSGANNIYANSVNPQQFNSAGAPSIDPSSVFRSMGDNDPSKAYQSLLSGDVINPYLSNIASDNFTMANRNLLENIMPGIGSQASVAGQYGGSRQGIAQGLAASRLNQDVTAANNTMFGNAYQSAQNNKLSAANSLAGYGMNAATSNASNSLSNNQFNANQGMSAATGNANRYLSADTSNASNQMNTQQFNANLGLSNNTQHLNQMNSAADWMNSGNNMQNTAIGNSLDLANYGNKYQNDALKNYSSTIGQYAGMGGSASSPYYTNPTNNLLGGAIAGSQIFKNIFS